MRTRVILVFGNAASTSRGNARQAAGAAASDFRNALRFIMISFLPVPSTAPGEAPVYSKAGPFLSPGKKQMVRRLLRNGGPQNHLTAACTRNCRRRRYYRILCTARSGDTGIAGACGPPSLPSYERQRFVRESPPA